MLEMQYRICGEDQVYVGDSHVGVQDSFLSGEIPTSGSKFPSSSEKEHRRSPLLCLPRRVVTVCRELV